FCAWERDVKGMGLMPPELPKLPADTSWDAVATPPMRAVRNLTRAFAGAKPLASTRPLQVQVTELGEPRKVFEGDATHPPLWQRESFAVLPFQVDESKFVIAIYAVTYDATKPFAEQTYRVKISGLPENSASVSLYDPVRDAKVPFKSKMHAGVIEVELPAVDYPRLLTIGR
ncbi:MAG TPA: hypothetical protein VLJ39_22075, partial [Tepidisphaeraceae bacterium]|nr:hypothetical protein [Tepidisphaeraceae bacterium]